MTVSFRLLGPLEIRHYSRALAVPTGQAPQVLGLLLLHAGGVVGIDALHDVLWDGDMPASSRKIIQVRVSQLRGLLAGLPVSITGSRQGYRLDVPPGSVDLHEFRRLVARAAGEDPATAASLLRQASRLWRGPAVPELAGTIRGMRIAAALSEERLAAAENYAEAALAAGLPVDELAGELAAVLVEHPLRERLRARLMLALLRAGRQSDALAVFEEGRRLLADELGLDPGAELRATHATVLRGESDVLDVPTQLPTDVYGFVGRGDALARLDVVLDAGSRQPTAVVVTVLSGTAGVGKTVLAVHWAHRVAHRFPDGQLYVNLRGFAQEGTAVRPDDAVRGFLDALGVAHNRLPSDPDAQAALYRSLLAGRRMLVVLDNARDAEQVRPLLPGAPGCLVVVTSRDQLTSLVVANGALPVTVDLLTEAEAGELLASRLGRARIAAAPEAVAEIIARCARLPLALAVVAAHAAARPTFSLAALAEELRGLDPLDGGDPSTDVRTVLSWSYQALGTAAARLFRLLAAHPGPDMTVPAAASLAGIPVADARRLLAELTRVHLLTEHGPGRYICHDLLRDYASELTDPDERRAAVRRVLDHHLHSALAADGLLRPRLSVERPPGREHGVTPETFLTAEQALAWFGAEYEVLLACVELSARTGFDTHTVRLAMAMVDFLERAGRWHDHADTQRTALTAATRLSDKQWQALAHRSLGRAYTWLRRHAEAEAELRQARDGFAALGDEVAHADVHLSLGFLFERQNRTTESLDQAREALRLFRACGHEHGQALALASVGWLLAQLGDYEQGLSHCEDAAALTDKAGDTIALANTTHSIGFIHMKLGQHPEALAAYERALVMFRDTGDRYYTGETLIRIGEVHHAMGTLAPARASWREALTILTELDHPDAAKVCALLRELDEADPVQLARSSRLPASRANLVSETDPRRAE